MFEQAILENGEPGKRILTTCAGVTGQMLLVTGLALGPLLWPQALPQLRTLLVFTPLPPPPAVHVVPVRPQAVSVAPQFIGKTLLLPTAIPDRVAHIEDPPDAFASNGGNIGISGGLGTVTGSIGILQEMLESVRPVPPPRLPEVVKPSALPEPVAPIRVRVGGVVQMATLIRRVDPQYPALAKQARVSGVVELEGVIGVDGLMRELVVRRGHPLLVRAALDAVRQWVYRPTFLNGAPVEVIAPITVTFHLN